MLPRLIAIAVVALGFELYSAGLARNPPAFWRDEASFALNAHLIAQTGHDEWGEPWPLYFRAFGEYKSPVCVYALAGLFSVVSPSHHAARWLSTLAGYAAALVLGVIALRWSRSRLVAILTFIAAATMPWLFEMSRLAMDVAFFPLAMTLTVLAVDEAESRRRWGVISGVAVALALGLVTYTYTPGRVIGPLLALSLLVFVRRGQAVEVLRVWLFYLLVLVPLLWFALEHPGALGARMQQTTLWRPDMHWLDAGARFLTNLVSILDPWRLLFEDVPKHRQHVPGSGMGSLSIAPFLAFLWGAIVIARSRRVDPSTRYVLLGLAAAFIPAATTRSPFNLVRLGAVPVFLLLIGVHGLRSWTDWARRDRAGRVVLAAWVALLLVQTAHFQRHFHVHGPRRHAVFDGGYSHAFRSALSGSQRRPLHVWDGDLDTLTLARWHAVVRSLPDDQIVRVAPDEKPPDGALVVGSMPPPSGARVLAARPPFFSYVFEADGPAPDAP